MSRRELSPHGRPFRVLTSRLLGDPPPDLEERRAKAAKRPPGPGTTKGSPRISFHGRN